MTMKPKQSQTLSLISDIEATLRHHRWLLDKCNHSSGNGNNWPHHVRDRLSEGIDKELEQVIESLDWIRDAVIAGFDPVPNAAIAKAIEPPDEEISPF